MNFLNAFPTQLLRGSEGLVAKMDYFLNGLKIFRTVGEMNFLRAFPVQLMCRSES